MESWLWDSAHIEEWETRLASYHNRQQRDAEWVIKGSPSSTCAWCKRTLPTLKAHFTLLTLLLDLQEHALRLTLFDELPDKERELFPGKSFLLFSKLPLELRRKIWRATFTPRHVDLSIYDCVVTPRPRWSINIDKHRLPYLPITLSVNRESRAETLQYYCYLFDNHANSSLDLKADATGVFQPEIRLRLYFICNDWCTRIPIGVWKSCLVHRFTGARRHWSFATTRG
jgi:hypothetical protein